MGILKKKKAILALEDGTVYHGYAFGAVGEKTGEVVFNTSMTGYQEILTDPSYAGQIVTMTYPLIGNYGINDEDNESRRPFVEGFVVREASSMYSNWRAKTSLQDFLSEYGIVGIEGVDTRALTKHIRSAGAMRGVISVGDKSIADAIEKAKNAPSMVGADLVKVVTVDEPYSWGDGGGAYKIVAFDYGMKTNIVRQLAKAGCDIRVVPAATSADEVLAMDPDGIFLSNGPGDPSAVTYAVDTIRQLIGKKPLFGICLGHQLLVLALGGKTYKLKFGHRGGNQPVKNLLNGRVEITSQNHGFAVDPASLSIEEKAWQVGQAIPEGGWSGKSDFGPVEITHINLSDGTVEGLRCLDVPAYSVQYHPEAAPGPHDAEYLFDQFIEMMGAK
ncbi:MAG: glutamine-hydrolyzing carbamoyl-phosphate synthase small subunit [Candidatus Aquicultor sp.]|nr:glutamine-hydrolyzing carbamoyl-phosphate synthase small subunit [Candidatus Aquicultor sp.]